MIEFLKLRTLRGCPLFGGGGGAPSSTSSTQVIDVPKRFRPLTNSLVNIAAQDVFTGTFDKQGKFTPTGVKPYVPKSSADYIAGFSPMQLQASKVWLI
jgi:hypothetical protein